MEISRRDFIKGVVGVPFLGGIANYISRDSASSYRANGNTTPSEPDILDIYGGREAVMKRRDRVFRDELTKMYSHPQGQEMLKEIATIHRVKPEKITEMVNGGKVDGETFYRLHDTLGINRWDILDEPREMNPREREYWAGKLEISPREHAGLRIWMDIRAARQLMV